MGASVCIAGELSLAHNPDGLEHEARPFWRIAMADCSRRDFAGSILKTLVTYSLFDALIVTNALGTTLWSETKQWSGAINEISNDLRKRKLSSTEWQDRVEQVFSGVDLPDLLSRIEFDQLQRRLDLPESGANWRDLNFREVVGYPGELSYVARVFGMKKGRSIVPHGHHNLVSCHLVVKGDLHVRNYERVRDEADALVIRPTIDKAISMRDCSTQSSLRNNVHWFTAQSSTAFTFDVFVQDLERDQPSGVDFIDPEHAENLGDGSLRARRLDVDEARKLYGGGVHH
jgi:hypothetical protein